MAAVQELPHFTAIVMKNTLLFCFLLLFFGLSKATVITFIPSNYQFDWQGGYLYIDANNDGFNDFLMTAEATLGIDTSWFKIKSLTAGTKILTDGTGKVSGLNDGVLISGQVPSNLWADSAWVKRYDGTPYPYPSLAYSNMAFRYSVGANDHYGYINGYLTDDSQSMGFMSYNILRIGYETTPGLGILANSETSIIATLAPTIPSFSMAQFQDMMRLDFERPVAATVEVCDLQGRVLMNHDFQGALCNLATGSLSEGIYLLRLTSSRNTGQPSVTKKFVLTRD